MYKTLRWKLLTIVVVIAVFCTVGVYPLMADHFHWRRLAPLTPHSLKRGRDLKGGVQLELRVNTDDALRITTTSTSEQLRDSLKNSSTQYGTITVTAPTTFRVEGIPQDRDSAFRTAADEIATNYDRNPQGAGTYEFRMKPTVERALRQKAADPKRPTHDH